MSSLTVPSASDTLSIPEHDDVDSSPDTVARTDKHVSFASKIATHRSPSIRGDRTGSMESTLSDLFRRDSETIDDDMAQQLTSTSWRDRIFTRWSRRGAYTSVDGRLMHIPLTRWQKCYCLFITSIITSITLLFLTFLIIQSIIYFRYNSISCHTLHDIDQAHTSTSSDTLIRYLRHNTHHIHHLRTLGTYQSYKHDITLLQQLDAGMRHIHLDLHIQPNRMGFRVYARQLVDDKSTCTCLAECLLLLHSWSEARQREHIPITVFLTLRTSIYDDMTPHVVMDGITCDTLDALEQTITSVFTTERVITPDHIRGEYETLQQALSVHTTYEQSLRTNFTAYMFMRNMSLNSVEDPDTFGAQPGYVLRNTTREMLHIYQDYLRNYSQLDTVGWPSLTKTRGQFLFIWDDVDDSASHLECIRDHPSLAQRILFPATYSHSRRAPYHAIITHIWNNNPTFEQSKYILSLLEQGLMIRVLINDKKQFVEAEKAGGHWITTLNPCTTLNSTSCDTLLTHRSFECNPWSSPHLCQHEIEDAWVHPNELPTVPPTQPPMHHGG